jgi:hypothetical protein
MRCTFFKESGIRLLAIVGEIGSGFRVKTLLLIRHEFLFILPHRFKMFQAFILAPGLFWQVPL